MAAVHLLFLRSKHSLPLNQQYRQTGSIIVSHRIGFILLLLLLYSTEPCARRRLFLLCRTCARALRNFVGIAVAVAVSNVLLYLTS